MNDRFYTPYQAATENQHDLTRCLSGEAWAEYQTCLRLMERLHGTLEDALSEEALRTFTRYLENGQTVAEWEREMYFFRGLSLGLQLGTLI